MWNTRSRSLVYWLLFADILIRFGIAGDPPGFFRIIAIFFHFLVGLRAGILLFQHLRPRKLLGATPLLVYGLALIGSTLRIDPFIFVFQWLLVIVILHIQIATDEADNSATELDGEPLSSGPSESGPGSPPPDETPEPKPGKWRIVLGIFLVCATGALNFYLATFETEGFNSMAVMFTHLFIYTPVLLSLSLPLLGSSQRGWPVWNQLLFILFSFFFLLSWVILIARAYGVW